LNLRNFCEKVRKKVRILFENVRKFQKFQKKYVKFEFLSQKNLFLGQKVWIKFRKILEKVWKISEIGFSECSEILEIVLFRNFQKLQKNDVKLELRKTDSKVRLKVRNAWP